MTNNTESSLLLQSTHLDNYAIGNKHHLKDKTDVEKDIMDLSEDNVDHGFSQLPPFIKNDPEEVSAKLKRKYVTPLNGFILLGSIIFIVLIFMMFVIYRK